MLDAYPAATLPLYPGLGQAQNMLACIPSGVILTKSIKAMKKTKAVTLTRKRVHCLLFLLIHVPNFFQEIYWYVVIKHESVSVLCYMCCFVLYTHR